MSDNMVALVIIAIVVFVMLSVLIRPSEKSLEKDRQLKEHELEMKKLELEERALEEKYQQSKPKVFKARKP